MKIRRHIFAVVTAAMLSTGAYAADIKVGVTGPYTGGSSSMGVSMRDGVRLAVKEINAAGGVNGNKIVLVERFGFYKIRYLRVRLIAIRVDLKRELEI